MPEVRYQKNGNNRLLLHVLVDLWGHQCYWCRCLKAYTDLEIDHILPRIADKSRRESLQREFGIGVDYDVHSPYNLAPICKRCNLEKGSVDLTRYGLVLTSLRKARRLASEVASRVDSFSAGFNLTDALIHVIEADLSDPTIREAFEREAPAVMQRLADLDESKADFCIFRTVDVEERYGIRSITLKLNERARAALTVLEEVAGGQLETALSPPMSDLSKRVGAAAASAIEDSGEELTVPRAEIGEVEWHEIIIDRIKFIGFPPARLEFEFSGALDAYVSASVARDDAVGELEFVQGEAVVHSRFAFSFSWTPADPIGVFDFDQVFLEDWDADASIEGERRTSLEYILGLEKPEQS